MSCEIAVLTDHSRRLAGSCPAISRRRSVQRDRANGESIRTASPACRRRRRSSDAVMSQRLELKVRVGRVELVRVRSAGRIRRVVGEVATWRARRTPRLGDGSRSTSRRGTSTPARSVGCRWAGLGGGPSPWRPGEMACPHGVVNCWIRSSTSWRPAVRRTPMPAGCSSVTVDERDVAEPGSSAGAPSLPHDRRPGGANQPAVRPAVSATMGQWRRAAPRRTTAAFAAGRPRLPLGIAASRARCLPRPRRSPRGAGWGCRRGW